MVTSSIQAVETLNHWKQRSTLLHVILAGMNCGASILGHIAELEDGLVQVQDEHTKVFVDLSGSTVTMGEGEDDELDSIAGDLQYRRWLRIRLESGEQVTFYQVREN